MYLAKDVGKADFDLNKVTSIIEMNDDDQEHPFYACKIAERANLGRVQERFINSECVNQSLVKSEYVARLEKAIKTDNRYYIMLEYCNGGDLDEIMTAKEYKISP